ncbi:hypothetical protein O181_097486 [Austropuccinia psidii MF-1]|uniref:Uncharacterized protein n=1 Tax=Austropuccinia psidii MF-1 TaxID=1389203 RepID=A0A9Q3J927_9BASI|nr:hypothetical protein [Austropuccinia psidii MF-1]
MSSYLHLKSFLGQEKCHRAIRRVEPTVLQKKGQKEKECIEVPRSLFIDQTKELEMTPALEKEGPVVSTSTKPAPEMSKDNPKGTQKKKRGPKNHQAKGKGKANWHRPYPQGHRIPQLEPSAMDSVFNMVRDFMEFTAKEQERMKRTFPCK